MSTDYAEKEREFLATLAADTGRDLAAWMHAIDAQKLSDKNDIIDWLRQQGFMFWKAAWLERIHSNSGQPIYVDAEPGSSDQPGACSEPIGDSVSPRPAATEASPNPQAKDEASVQTPLRPDLTAIDEVLAKAKALQPLARHLLGKIEKAIPEGQLNIATTSSLSIGCPQEFAVLTISARELKLGLALAGRPVEAPFAAAPAAAFRGAAAITHMALLKDARQIDDFLISAIREAATACQKAVTP